MYVRPKALISAGAKKSPVRDVLNYLNDIQHIFTRMIGFVTWLPFLYQPCYKGDQVTKPIIRTCENML